MVFALSRHLLLLFCVLVLSACDSSSSPTNAEEDQSAQSDPLLIADDGNVNEDTTTVSEQALNDIFDEESITTEPANDLTTPVFEIDQELQSEPTEDSATQAPEIEFEPEQENEQENETSQTDGSDTGVETEPDSADDTFLPPVEADPASESETDPEDDQAVTEAEAEPDSESDTDSDPIDEVASTVVDLDSESDSDNEAIQSDPLELGSFELRLDTTSFELTEANPDGVSVPISINRLDGHVRPVLISVSPETERDGHQLDAQTTSNELLGNETNTSWEAVLGISVGPIVFHERRFLVSADDGRQEFRQAITVAVTPISAPDIYLLIGQSNMEGFSELGAKDSSPGGLDAINPRIRQLNVTQNDRKLFNNPSLFTDEDFNTSSPVFIPAEDPLHEPRVPFRNDKDGTFVGPGLSFARAALNNTTTDIVLVPAAWSGRGFCANNDAPLSWNANESAEPALGGTLLTDRALTRLNMTIRDTGGIFRGILWHQGEADSNNRVCAERYEGNVIELVQRIRREAMVDARGQSARGDNAAIPFVLGTMSRGSDERGDFSTYSNLKQRIDDVHRNLPGVLPFSETVVADDLVPPAFQCGNNSCIHFGAAAYREIGGRYYQAIQRVFDNNR